MVHGVVPQMDTSFCAFDVPRSPASQHYEYQNYDFSLSYRAHCYLIKGKRSKEDSHECVHARLTAIAACGTAPNEAIPS
jgi:hypothetical protein